jgi:membrane fusion protein, multidrug efflux system
MIMYPKKTIKTYLPAAKAWITSWSKTTLIAVVVFLSSCGSKESEDLAGLKSKQAELKTQLAEVTAKINKLEGDSAGKFILIEAAPLSPETFKTYINVQGRIDAEESVSLSSEMPGTITKINVQVGDQVSKGQVLAETDSRAIQQQLAAMNTSLTLVKQMYEKQKNLWDEKIGTEMQFLQVKAMKEATESAVNAMNEQLRMTKIISPIDGTVDGVDIKLGQLTAPGIPAIRVINFSNLKVKADLAESYASKVHKGDEVLIKFPDTNDTLSAKVTYAARAISAMNRTFGVEILLDNKKEYHPNQIAILNINDYRSAKPMMSVPLSFVQKDVNGQSYIMVVENNKAAKKNVTLGKQYNGRVELVEGISATDSVITSGYEGLNEGDGVKIKK